MKIQLCCAPLNTQLKIISLTGKNRGRLSEMGFNKNEIVFVKNATYNHETLSINVKGSIVALRKDEAKHIIVELEGEKDVHI
jgi:hypothetical protein